MLSPTPRPKPIRPASSWRWPRLSVFSRWARVNWERRLFGWLTAGNGRLTFHSGERSELPAPKMGGENSARPHPAIFPKRGGAGGNRSANRRGSDLAGWPIGGRLWYVV